jgi:hypothetical protein
MVFNLQLHSEIVKDDGDREPMFKLRIPRRPAFRISQHSGNIARTTKVLVIDRS